MSFHVHIGHLYTFFGELAPHSLFVCKLGCAVVSWFSRVRLFAVAHQAPLLMGILQARILEWVAEPSSRGSSPPRDHTPHLFCLLHWQLGSLPLVPPGKPRVVILVSQIYCALDKVRKAVISSQS